MNVRSASTAVIAVRRRVKWRQSLLATPLVLTLLLISGCNEESQDLDERVTELQKQLDQSQTELQATKQSLNSAQEELTHLRENPAPITPVAPPPVTGRSELPSRAGLETAYTASAKTLKQEVQAKLKGYSLEKCTLHNVEMPSEEYPVTSTISLSIRSGAGKSFQLDLPAKADRTGKWVLPEAQEIAQRIEEIGGSAVLASAQRDAVASSVDAPMQQQSGGGAGLAANRTVVVRWPNSAGPTSQTPRGNAPATEEPAANKAQPPVANNSTGLPANRTVVIQWPDGGTAPATSNPARGSSPAPEQF